MHTCRSHWLLLCSPHICGTSGACVLLVGRKMSPGDANMPFPALRLSRQRPHNVGIFPEAPCWKKEKSGALEPARGDLTPRRNSQSCENRSPLVLCLKTKSYVRTDWMSLHLFVPQFNVTVLNGSPFFLYLAVFICLTGPVRTDVQAWLVRLSVSRF